jgi:hypothetical protein
VFNEQLLRAFSGHLNYHIILAGVFLSSLPFTVPAHDCFEWHLNVFCVPLSLSISLPHFSTLPPSISHSNVHYGCFLLTHPTDLKWTCSAHKSIVHRKLIIIVVFLRASEWVCLERFQRAQTLQNVFISSFILSADSGCRKTQIYLLSFSIRFEWRNAFAIARNIIFIVFFRRQLSKSTSERFHVASDTKVIRHLSCALFEIVYLLFELSACSWNWAETPACAPEATRKRNINVMAQ